jgi:segregation and condensation protein B
MLGVTLDWMDLRAFLPSRRDRLDRSAIAPLGAGLQLRRGAGTGQAGKARSRRTNVRAADAAGGAIMMEELPEDRADSLICPRRIARRSRSRRGSGPVRIRRAADAPATVRPSRRRAVDGALEQLVAHYAGRGIELVERGGCWHFQTAADLAHLLRGARGCAPPVAGRDRGLGDHRLSRTGQPRRDRGDPGRADIARHAGRAAGSGLDRVAGRREVPGRPTIYATTPGFLAHFGLESRRDLPGIDELRAAGLLDPVDDVFAALTGHDDEDQADAEPAFSDVEDESCGLIDSLRLGLTGDSARDVLSGAEKEILRWVACPYRT